MPPDWDVEADVVVVGFGAAGACAALEAAAAGCFGADPGPVRRRRGHGAVRRGRLRRRRHAAAARGRRHRHPRGDVRLPAHRGRRRGAGRYAAGVLRRQRGHAGLAGGPRRAVRGQPVPGQDLVPDQPPLPVLLRQRTVRRRGSRCCCRLRSRDRRWAGRAARAPGPGPRHLGRAAVRPAGRRGPGQRRRRAHPDRRAAAGHRAWRPGHRRGVPVPARRARLGPAGPPHPAPLVGQAVPVRAQGRPDPAPPGRLAGAAVQRARCASGRRAAWSWRPAVSPPTGR